MLERHGTNIPHPPTTGYPGIHARKPSPVTNRLVSKASGEQAGVDAVLVRVDQGAGSDGTRDDRPDRGLRTLAGMGTNT